MRKVIALSTAAAIAAFVAACDTNQGPFEETGEQLDEAAENLEDGVREATEDLDDPR